MGTLGDSTSKYLAGIIRGANSNNGPGISPGAKYHGEWAGGGGGTWGRAATSRRDAHVTSPKPLQRIESNISSCSVGKRSKIRTNSEGVKALWDTAPINTVPKAPAKGGRPASPMKTCTHDCLVTQDRQRCVHAGKFVPAKPNVLGMFLCKSAGGGCSTRSNPLSSNMRDHQE
jgi:hypothetical protein